MDPDSGTKVVALRVACALLWMVACSGHGSRAPQLANGAAPPTIDTTPAPPSPAANATHVVEVDSDRLDRLRQSFGPVFTDVAVVSERPSEHHGRHTIVIARGVTRDSSAIVYELLVYDSLGQVERTVGTVPAPWPDYTLRVEQVTADSIYLTGTSASYGKTLRHGYEWWPLVRPRRAAALAPVPPRTAATAPVCGDTLVVDLATHTIAAIWMDQEGDVIRRQVGPAHVVVQTERREGNAVNVDVIALCGHEVRRTGDRISGGVSWTDPVFRTREGLGVGSTLAAFDTVYGRGEAIAEEGNSVRYYPPEGGTHFFLDVSDGCFRFTGNHVDVDRSCRVVRVSFITITRH